MGLSLGNKNIRSIYKGNKSIGKIYLGNKLIFQKSVELVKTLFTFTDTYETTFTDTIWLSPINVVKIDYLIVGGGGGGGYKCGGGGGAGGVVIGTLDNPIPDKPYTIKVGDGGRSYKQYSYRGVESYFGELVMIDYMDFGIGEGQYIIMSNPIARAEGGGAGSNVEFSTFNEGASGGGAYWGAGSTIYKGVIGQGYDGGKGNNTTGTQRGSGGGGGSAQKGGDATATSGGKGGDGIYIGNDWGNIGVNGYIAGGGGGGKIGTGSPGGAGGLGGGGDASQEKGVDGIPNTGSGGGASSNINGDFHAGTGGSGIVVLKVYTDGVPVFNEFELPPPDSDFPIHYR